jgi:hypothetical protein
MVNGIFDGAIADQEGIEVLILEQDEYADVEDTIMVDGERVIDHHWSAEFEPLAVQNLYENMGEANAQRR